MHRSLAPEVAIELIIQSIQSSTMDFTERIQALALGADPIAAVQQGHQKAVAILKRHRACTTTVVQKSSHLHDSSIKRASWTDSSRRGQGLQTTQRLGGIGMVRKPGDQIIQQG